MREIPSGEFKMVPMPLVIFGKGSAQKVTQKVEELGAKRALIVTVPSLLTTGLVERIKTSLGSRYAGVFSGVVQHVPRECVIEGAKLAREVGADMLISLGGSSTADAAKAIRLVLAESTNLEDFFNDFKTTDAVKRGVFDKPKLPQIAIPTTLSGGEINSAAGITDAGRKHKDVFRNAKLAVQVVILDPEMAATCPKGLWASTAMKTFSDCFEEICSPRHQPFADALAMHSIRIINENLASSLSEPADLSYRAMLQHAAWMSMQGAITASLGIIAALRHQLGGVYGVPHGVASTIVFPYCLEFNRPLIDDRLVLAATALDLPNDTSRNLAGQTINRVRELIGSIGLPLRLRDVGIPAEGLQAIADATMQDDSLQRNPRPVKSREELIGLLQQAW